MTCRITYLIFLSVLLCVSCKKTKTAEKADSKSVLKFVEKANFTLRIDSSSGVSIPDPSPISRKFVTRFDSADAQEPINLRKLNVGKPDSFPALTFAFNRTSAIPKRILPGVPRKTEASDYDSKDVNSSGFSLLGIRQGLPDQMLRCIVQDSTGFLWFAHQRSGITRFDGTHFFNYSVEQGLPSNDIYTLCFDKNNVLWIGSNDQGLFSFDGNSITHYTTEHGLCSNSINTVYSDKQGRIWAGSNGAGVSVIERGKITSFSSKQGMPGDVIWRFLETENNEIIIAGSNGITIAGPTQLNLYSYKHGLPDSTIWSLNKDRQGNFLIGTANEGLLRWDGTNFYTYESSHLNNYSISDIEWRADSSLWLSIYGEGLVRIKEGKSMRYGISNGLSGLMVLDILEDREGSLWAATYGSELSRLSATDFYHIAQTSLPQKIKTIFEFDDKTLWMGSSGQGIFELKNNQLFQLVPKRSPGILRISCMARDRNNNVWFGTIDNGIACINPKSNEVNWFVDENTLKGTYVTDMLCDDNGKLWIATDVGLSVWDGRTFRFIDTGKNENAGFIRKLHQDKAGAIWLLFDQGMAKITGEKITHYAIERDSQSIKILSFLEDASGDLWLGTEKDGLLRVRKHEMLHYSSSDGLLDNSILFIRQDYSGNFFIGHSLGLSKIQALKYFGEQPRVEQIVFEDGFTGTGIIRESALLTSDGKIWVVSNTQISRIESRKTQATKTRHSTYLNDVDLFGESVDWNAIKGKSSTTSAGIKLEAVEYDKLINLTNLPQNLILPHSSNFISFSFSGISQYQASNIKYSWMLEGVDDYWSSPQHITGVRYANLAPGNYRFIVKSTRDGKTWSNAPEFKFVINPPWWQTRWMYGVYIVGFITLVWGFISWRNYRLAKRAAQLEDEVEKATITIREQNEQVRREKEKSDNLLLNILPQKVAEELKETGFTKARYYQDVSVLFTDFKGFTTISSRLSTSALVDLINTYFSEFDAIMERNGIEKIKTIGDAYMAVGGMPESDPQHAYKTVKAAMDIKECIEVRKKEALLKNEPYFDIRIGVHSGPVVAGVVGTHKFQYDVWGDTVNTASRLESSSEAGMVNISGVTYELIKNHGAFTHRGKIAAKGKGEIDMYFVDRLI
jgi:ligand-binding sensor domain-containing protein/class 3 adenylate cyclase